MTDLLKYGIHLNPKHNPYANCVTELYESILKRIENSPHKSYVVAEECNMHSSNYSDIKRRKVSPSIVSLEKIVTALDRLDNKFVLDKISDAVADKIASRAIAKASDSEASDE